MPEHLHGGHRQRLKNRYLMEGLDHFTSHEVLELILTFAIPQKDVNPLSHTLIAHFGSLRAVFAATQEELQSVPGVGEHSAALIRLFLDTQRYLAISAEEKPMILSSAHTAGRFFISYLGNESYECFALACMRSDFSLIRVQKLNRGSLTEIPIFTRTAVEFAFRQHAYGVILAHNHPSGNCMPSGADLQATQSLQQALGILDIKLMDHFIVTQNQFFSIFSNQLIKPQTSLQAAPDTRQAYLTDSPIGSLFSQNDR